MNPYDQQAGRLREWNLGTKLQCTVPPEIWNRLGTKIIPKLKSGSDLKIGVDFSVTVNAESARGLESVLRQILEDLGLKGRIKIE